MYFFIITLQFVIMQTGVNVIYTNNGTLSNAGKLTPYDRFLEINRITLLEARKRFNHQEISNIAVLFYHTERQG